MTTKLIKGRDVTICIPFTYTAGEEGPVTGNIIETVEDAMDEVRAEIERGMNPHELYLTSDC